jgi:hypothetical protein
LEGNNEVANFAFQVVGNTRRIGPDFRKPFFLAAGAGAIHADNSARQEFYMESRGAGSAIAGRMGPDPGSARLHTTSLRLRDHYQELATFEAELFGLSTQPTDYQREMAERLRLPFEFLSDDALIFANALKLPTFEAGGMRLIKRLTLIIRGGRIETVLYPVFPSYESAARVIAWLERHPS